MILDALYHWSPTGNRKEIAAHGIQIMRPVSDDFTNPDGSPVCFPWVCLGTTPLTAWHLVPQGARRAVETWDLWEIRLADADEFEVRGDLGRRIQEVRIWHGLPSDRARFVGTRGYGLHDTPDSDE